MRRRQVFSIPPPVPLLASLSPQTPADSPGRAEGRDRAAAVAYLLGPAPFLPANPSTQPRSAPSPFLVSSPPPTQLTLASPETSFSRTPPSCQHRHAPQRSAGRGRLEGVRGRAQSRSRGRCAASRARGAVACLPLG